MTMPTTTQGDSTMPATTAITTACINCHAEAPKLAKGLCKPCYDYQRHHGGARPLQANRLALVPNLSYWGIHHELSMV